MSKKLIPKAAARLKGLLRQRDGALTQQLVLQPAQFGLGKVPSRLVPDNTTTVICGFCATGCGLTVHLKDAKAINITPATDYPVNLGMACPKGWESLAPLQATDRALTPSLRNAQGTLEPTDWDTALQTFCLRMKAIQHQHGSHSVAFISTGQIVSEEMALLGALTKFGMGMVHGDGNTRQCMATAVTAYKQSFGFDAPPYTYQDFEESDVIVLVGSNLCIAHPIMWQRVLRNKRKPEIIVIDPRRTETAVAATQHFAIRPKSDLVFFYGLAHILIRDQWIKPDFIKQHTEGFEEFKAHVVQFPPEYVASVTGINTEKLETLARLIGQKERVSFWWTMGVNQSHEGTRVAQSLINLALMTGNIGRPGTGANSITGQCNAMGSRLFSNTTNLLGGHDFTNQAHRQKIAEHLSIDERFIPAENSWAYDQILAGIESGSIKGLWIIATNTAHSWLNQQKTQELLSKLDFLVVQDMYHSTETAQLAHLILPAAGWGEKEGTFINSERRIGLVKKISKAPGQSLSDFSIFKLIAQYWGCADLFQKWSSPEAVFQLLGRISRGQPCDISGILDYQMIDEANGIQWPYREGDQLSDCHRRLFENGEFFHPNKRARFIYESPRPVPEPCDAEYPFILLTGRGTSAQWHTQTRTAKSAVLRSLYPAEIYVEIHADDAKRLGIRSGDWVRVFSRRGQVEAQAFLTAAVFPGQVFIPMHYATANQLTLNSMDTYSRQPSYKNCAVAITLVNGGKKPSALR